MNQPAITIEQDKNAPSGYHPERAHHDLSSVVMEAQAEVIPLDSAENDQDEFAVAEPLTADDVPALYSDEDTANASRSITRASGVSVSATSDIVSADPA